MQYLTMDWFEKFHCIASRCTVTCCTTDWGIYVDDETYKKYRAMESPFGKELVCKIDEETHMMKKEGRDGNCPLLDGEGLCEIIKQTDETYLCATCQIFPRRAMLYGDVEEYGVTISCPAVAEYLFSEEKINFISEKISDSEKSPAYPDYDKYCALSQIRSFCIELLQKRQDLPLIGRLYIVKQIDSGIQNLWKNGRIDHRNVQEILGLYRNEEYIGTMAKEVGRLHHATKVTYRAVFHVLQVFSIEEIKNAIGEQLVDTMVKLWQEKFCVEEEFCNIAEGFTGWCRQRQSVYENYFIYQLFLYFIDLPQGRSFFATAVIELLCIQLLAMDAWDRQELTRQRYCEIIAKTSRYFEHSEQKRDAIACVLEQFQLNDNANLLFWLLI